MMRRSSAWYVFLQNQWVRFSSFEEAEKAEGEANAARYAKAKAAGVRVIAIATPLPREPKRDRERVLFTDGEES